MASSRTLSSELTTEDEGSAATLGSFADLDMPTIEMSEARTDSVVEQAKAGIARDPLVGDCRRIADTLEGSESNSVDSTDETSLRPSMLVAPQMRLRTLEDAWTTIWPRSPHLAR